MRATAKADGITVRAIAGTHVVLLGMDASAEARRGLLGFTIARTDQATGRRRVLRGHRHFAFACPAETAGGPITLFAGSDEAPIQSFVWGDYAATPGTAYDYAVRPVYGAPRRLAPGRPVRVRVTTEALENGTHGVFFNRGVAGSQAYARQFGSHRRWYLAARSGRLRWQQFVRPADVPDGAAWRWLSRGLEEAMLAFIARAEGPDHALRGAVYEFTHEPVIRALAGALERGADVRIIHHAKPVRSHRLKLRQPRFTTTVSHPERDAETFGNARVVQESGPDATGAAAVAATRAAGLMHAGSIERFEKMLLPRRDTQISHNKFLVLLEKGRPVAVWTGSTNFTAGGIFGQSNVGHLVNDADVAARYLEYWEKLSRDPPRRASAGAAKTEGLAAWTTDRQPDLDGAPPEGVTVIFSPRVGAGMLAWYGELMGRARQSVHFTSAFTIAREIEAGASAPPERGDALPLRYMLLESRSGQFMRAPFARLQKIPNNRFAWGETLQHDAGDEEERIETLTGLNDFVSYAHTKYMLVDPLGSDPVLISGSANFSAASTTKNDENMLVIRGDTRVADIYLGEFMRLFNHYRIRNELNAMAPAARATAHHLVESDAWTDPWFARGSQLAAERMLFAGTAAEL